MKTDFVIGALNVRESTNASTTSEIGKVREKTSDMRNDIGLLMVLGKIDVVGAKGGRPRVSSIKINCVKTACSSGAKHVQIKLPTSLIRSGGRL